MICNFNLSRGDEIRVRVVGHPARDGYPPLVLAHVDLGTSGLTLDLAEAVELRDQLAAAIAEHEERTAAAPAAS